MNKQITIDQVPAEVIKAWVINGMLMAEYNWSTSNYSVDFDELHYECNKGLWFVLTMSALAASNKFFDDYRLAATDNLKFKLGLLKEDFTCKTKEDFNNETEYRELQRTFAKSLMKLYTDA